MIVLTDKPQKPIALEDPKVADPFEGMTDTEMVSFAHTERHERKSTGERQREAKRSNSIYPDARHNYLYWLDDLGIGIFSKKIPPIRESITRKIA